MKLVTWNQHQQQVQLQGLNSTHKALVTQTQEGQQNEAPKVGNMQTNNLGKHKGGITKANIVIAFARSVAPRYKIVRFLPK